MAIDKSHTKLGTKILLIVVAGSFVLSLVPVFGSFGDLFKGPEKLTPQEQIDRIATEYKGQVTTLETLAQSNPASYTILVSLGNTYFDWAAQTQSIASTNSLTSDLPLWTSAKNWYSQATSVTPGDSGVNVDFAIATFYSGDASSAVVIATKVVEKDPKFAPAWFNLGIFYETMGNTLKATQAYETYLKLDPNGQQGNAGYARQQIQAIKSAVPSTTP